jgi:hypothetical protein
MGRFSLVAVAAICVLAASSKVRFFSPGATRDLDLLSRQQPRFVATRETVTVFSFSFFKRREESDSSSPWEAPLLAFLSSRRWRAAPLAYFYTTLFSKLNEHEESQ